MDPLAMTITAVTLAAAVAVGCAVVRIVPPGHRGVVTRAGRVARSRPAGPALVLPGLEGIEMVALHPTPIEPLGITALTRDGVDVRLVVSVLWRVRQPSLVLQAVPDATALTAATVERVLHQLVANVDLATLLRDRGSLLTRLPVTASPLVSHCGVEIVDVDLLDVEVRVGPELLRLLR